MAMLKCHWRIMIHSSNLGLSCTIILQLAVHQLGADYMSPARIQTVTKVKIF